MIKEKIKRGNDSFLEDIWKIHTDVQEQMLQLRSVPIRVIPESAKVIGEKLYLSVDEYDKTDIFLESIKKLFNIDSDFFNLTDGYFYVETNQAKKVSVQEKNDISQKAAANFIEFFPNPIIDGYIKKLKSPIIELKDVLIKSKIDYNFDKKGRLQISIKELKLLNKLCSDVNINISIPEKSSIIIPIYPNPLYFIKKEFPFLTATHKTRLPKRKENERDLSFIKTIEISGRYFKDKIAERLYNEFGLSLIGYDLIFYINPTVVGRYNCKNPQYTLPKLNEDNSFVFHTPLNTNFQNGRIVTAEDGEILDFNLKYTRLNQFFNTFFGIENVRYESSFIYSYDTHKLTKEFLPSKENTYEEFWQEVSNSITSDKVTVSANNESVGIDFDWKNEEIENLIINLARQCPVIDFYLFSNHRCNIDFQIQDVSLDESETQLREKFPSIKTKRDNKKGTLYFYQEYQLYEQAILLKDMIRSELDFLDKNIFETGLYDIPKNKDKYKLFIDVSARKEAQKSAIKELRGAEFKVYGKDMGKLFRVNFPEMIFDISGINYQQIKELFEEKNICLIQPNLIGDIEKINRLKSSLNNILEGKKFQNRNLKDFIFDASKALRIDNIEFYTDPFSETFQDLESHLLNKKINEPQKGAIIKTLLAQDLAIIQGPPGTGKSTAIAEIIWQHIRKNPKERILLTSETNLAVDNAIDRIVNNKHNLVKPIRFGGEEKLEMEGRQFSIEIMKGWVENGIVKSKSEEFNDDEAILPQKLILKNWIENIQRRIDRKELDDISTELWEKCLSDPPKSIRQIFYNSYIKNCNVIGATCSSIGELNTRGNATSFFKSYCEIFGKVDQKIDQDGEEYYTYKGDLKFTTVIQDESSKATPAELSLPLIYGKKNIIIGDHRQLPPLLDKESFILSFNYLLSNFENEEEIKKIIKLKEFVSKNFKELEISHFERLYNKIDSSLKGIFNLQYRMHPDINEVIKQFYIDDGGLECGLISPTDLGVNDPNMSNPSSRYHGIEIDNLVSKNNHVIWIDTNSPEMLEGTSRINFGEVEIVREILSKFRASESFNKFQSCWKNPEDQQIGIISFYGKQLSLLKDLTTEFRDIPTRVSTVDRFQGMERNIIIVSMVRSNRIATDKHQKSDKTLYGDLGYPEQFDLGFAQSPNRLNVALSRAKRLVIIIGNSELFRKKLVYNNVYETIEKNPNGIIIKYPTK